MDDENPNKSAMPMYDKTLAQAMTGSVEVSALSPRRLTVTEMLLAKKQHLEYQLKQVDEALNQAKANTGAMALIDSIAKTQIRQEY